MGAKNLQQNTPSPRRASAHSAKATVQGGWGSAPNAHVNSFATAAYKFVIHE